MAKAKKNAVVKWEDEMSKAADIAAEMEEGSGGGQFFSTQSGQLSWMGNPLPNNEMAVVILDSILENVYYEGAYDSDNVKGPVCFAFGRDPQNLAPHKIVVEAGQNAHHRCGVHNKKDCCEFNEFHSSDTGKGKACKNTRRIAMIPAGTFNKDGDFEIIEKLEHFKTAAPGFMRLPVMSVDGYAGFVKAVSGTLRRPPYGIVTRVSVVPDTKSQFKVVFEPIEELPDEIMPTICERHKEVEAVIDFPYTPRDDDDEKPVKTKVAKKPSKKKNRKY